MMAWLCVACVAGSSAAAAGGILLPLAIGLMIFGYIFFGMAVSLVFMLISPSLSWFGDGDVIAVLFAIFFLGLNIAMEFAIGMRLRQLAAR